MSADPIWLGAIFSYVLLAGLIIALLILLRAVSKAEQDARAENETLRRSRKNVQTAHAQIVSDLKTKQQELLLLQAQSQSAQESSEQKIAELIDTALTLRTQLEGEQQRVAHLDCTLAEQQTLLTSMTLELEEAKQQAAQAHTLQRSADELANKLADAEQTISAQQAHLSNLMRQLDQAERAAAQVPQLVSQIDKQKSMLTDLTNQLKQLEETASRVTALETTINEQRAKIAEADHVLSSQRSAIIELSTQLGQAKEHSAQLDSVLAQLDRNKHVIADLTTQLDQARQQAAQLLAVQVQVDAQQTRLADSERMLKEYEATITDLTYQRDQAKQEIAQLSASLMQIPTAYSQGNAVRVFENRSLPRRRVMHSHLNGDGDELETINGIGPIYAARLRSAGMRTFKSIANATAGDLEKIIKPHRWQRPDYADWIIQAKKLTQP